MPHPKLTQSELAEADVICTLCRRFRRRPTTPPPSLPAPDVDPAVFTGTSSPLLRSRNPRSLPLSFFNKTFATSNPTKPRRAIDHKNSKRKREILYTTHQTLSMSSPDGQFVKKARMLRHAQRDVPNALKARFSPTAIWTAESVTEASEPTTTAAVTGPITPPAVHTTSSSVTLVRPSTASTSSTPTSTSTSTPTPVLSTPTTTTASSSPTSTSTSSTSSTSTPITTSSTSTSTTSISSLTPTSTTSSSILTTSSQTTAFVTETLSTSSHAVASASGSALDSASSSTPSASSSSGISTAGIVGIAAAGIVGAAVLAGLVVFFLRRWNRKEDDFDPADFRRQSIVLRDDNSSLHRGNSNGRGPRPPTMFERHNQNIAAFATSPMPPSNAYHPPAHPYGSPSPFSDFAASQASPSFTPGMYVPASTASPAPSGQYANASPFYNPSFQSPVGSPVTVASYGGAAYDAQGRLARAPSNAAASVLLRNDSIAHPQYPAEEFDYADLSRASVTPFQAAQYEAISKQLNIAPPKALHQVAEADEPEESHRADRQSLPVSAMDAKPSIDISPFDDPHIGSVQNTASAFADEDIMKFKPSRPSSEFHSMSSFPLPMDTFPRVTSQPPSLPEIQMVNGTFSPVNYNFPVTPSPCNGSFDVQSGRASPKVDLPPLSPVTTSPQRAHFVDGNESRAHDGRETPVEIGFVADNASASKTDLRTPVQAKIQAPKRPETVYDDEDAYGGI